LKRDWFLNQLLAKKSPERLIDFGHCKKYCVFLYYIKITSLGGGRGKNNKRINRKWRPDSNSTSRIIFSRAASLTAPRRAFIIYHDADRDAPLSEPRFAALPGPQVGFPLHHHPLISSKDMDSVARLKERLLQDDE
jgi:hypothetical protein